MGREMAAAERDVEAEGLVAVRRVAAAALVVRAVGMRAAVLISAVCVMCC
jgi:hypothetical protein